MPSVFELLFDTYGDHVLQYEGRDYLALVLGLAVTAGIIVLRQFT